MNYLDNLKGSLNLLNPFKCFFYKREFAQLNPTYFYPEGLLVFCAEQGSRENFIGCSILHKSK